MGGPFSLILLCMAIAVVYIVYADCERCDVIAHHIFDPPSFSKEPVVHECYPTLLPSVAHSSLETFVHVDYGSWQVLDRYPKCYGLRRVQLTGRLRTMT